MKFYDQLSETVYKESLHEDFRECFGKQHFDQSSVQEDILNTFNDAKKNKRIHNPNVTQL